MPKNDSSWGLLVNLGSQLLAGVLLGLLIGQWFDRKYGWTPWATLVCTLLGVAGGMYSMIREGLRANRDAPDKKPPKTGA
ncbi:MAG TPA: AtpZ/AtpI family protein [Tepidisphaeraceae bacterium]|nr:AtpZ/AtpI family protein [Tepidisphaeraceae bacterium]